MSFLTSVLIDPSSVMDDQEYQGECHFEFGLGTAVKVNLLIVIEVAVMS